ncbi:hypothetical protein DDIC_07955 [Desulfovibrio desulfuricans]|uniref:Uncharacterized protein n=1 Tax=Desulfovibrio desulfuricans TaxID=876 RepID=A0A4P7UJF1_DESDE|nr:hypothetical protein [Desulfovibrio desulfuricans]QCC85807.1 hypothetical protein DDIC_07955 [Desulfovibrio desulfuricans]
MISSPHHSPTAARLPAGPPLAATKPIAALASLIPRDQQLSGVRDIHSSELAAPFVKGRIPDAFCQHDRQRAFLPQWITYGIFRTLKKWK